MHRGNKGTVIEDRRYVLDTHFSVHGSGLRVLRHLKTELNRAVRSGDLSGFVIVPVEIEDNPPMGPHNEGGCKGMRCALYTRK